MKYYQDRIHQFLAKSSLAAKLAAKIRNQANCVIGYYLGPTAHPSQNGEFLLLKQLSPHIETFIDVGANVGDWTEYLIQHSQATGYLFEPSIHCVNRLRERFAGTSIIIRPVSVADFSGSAILNEEINCGLGSSLANIQHRNKTIPKKTTVTTLDLEFYNAKQSISFLKIDTEGYDLRVMKGAKQLLRRVRFLQFEYNSYWLSANSSLAEANRFLSELGFCIFLIRSTGLHPLRYELWGDYFRYSNFFACRPSDFHCIHSLLRHEI